VAAPSIVSAGQSTTVTITVDIPAPNLIAQGVNLLQVNGGGRPPANLGQMRDDGLEGDAVAGDRVFTKRVAVLQTTATELGFAVSAAFRAQLTRVMSTPVIVKVWPVAGELGISINHPPAWRPSFAPQLARVMFTNDLIGDGIEFTSSSLRVRRRQNRNADGLPIVDWFEAEYAAGATEMVVERSILSIDGRTALRVESVDMVPLVHVYIPDDTDIIEIDYTLDSPTGARVYEEMIRTLRFSTKSIAGRRRENGILRLLGTLAAIGTPTQSLGLLNSTRSLRRWAVTPRARIDAAGDANTVPCTDVVSCAAREIGDEYQWGEDGPDAWDCSGLAMSVYTACKPLSMAAIPPELNCKKQSKDPRCARSYRLEASDDNGSRVTGNLAELLQNGQLQPGDLLFFDSPNDGDDAVDHVGIYEGGTTMIHAYRYEKAEETGVVRHDLVARNEGAGLRQDYYLRAFKSARRGTCKELVVIDLRGPGRVRSEPPGIDCPEACGAEFTPGSLVRLTAEPVPGATFERWEVGCSGNGACEVTVQPNTIVKAVFGCPPPKLIGVGVVSLCGSWKLSWVDGEAGQGLYIRTQDSFSGWPGTATGDNDFAHVQLLLFGHEIGNLSFYEDSSGDADEIRPLRIKSGPVEGTYLLELADPEHPDEFELKLLLQPA
jgi:cell wall-associated NlpC family hydrolase